MALNEDISHNPPRKKSPKTAKKPRKKSTKKTPPPVKKSSGKALFLGIVAFFGIITVLFYAMVVWASLSGSGLFTSLGIGPAALKSLALGMTNFLFGVLSLWFLVVSIIRIFRWLITPRDQKETRRGHSHSAIFYGILLVFAVVMWVILYMLISRVEAQEAVQNQNLILTKPESVIGLEAPVTVDFDIGTLLSAQLDRSLWRQIEWDFDGDGEVDARTDKVSHRFTGLGENGGNFPVTATVSFFNPNTKTVESRVFSREVIIANERVSAVISANITEGPAPLSVEFSALESRDPDGEILEYAWDFDEDGVFEIAGQDALVEQFTFPRVGEYEVKLRVRGVNNDTATETVTINVLPPDTNLKAVIQSSSGFEGPVPLTLTLDGTGSLSNTGNIVKYEWYIEGEPRPRPGRETKVTFRDAGTYRVRLVVTNQDGENAETEQDITVLEDLSLREIITRSVPPMAPKTKTISGKAPFAVTLDTAQSTIKDPVSWEWDFEDDGIVDAFRPAVNRTFAEAGTFLTKLKIVDASGHIFEEEYTILVSPAGTIARINADPQSGVVPFTTTFDGSASSTDEGEIINYIWQFPGKAPISYQSKISTTFDTIGDFPVRLKIVTSTGAEAEEEILISVRNQPVKAIFSASKTTGEVPLEVKFDPRESLGTIFKFDWDFGDGRTSTQFQPTHVYRTPGTYRVTLTVTDAKGIVDEESLDIEVLSPTP